MEDHQLLLALLQRYMDGLYRGDTALLREVFHPQAHLFGEVRGQILMRDLDTHLGVMAGRQSAAASGERQHMWVQALDVTGAIAVATVHCPMLGFNYLNQLSLLKEKGRWFIVNKLYSHLED